MGYYPNDSQIKYKQGSNPQVSRYQGYIVQAKEIECDKVRTRLDHNNTRECPSQQISNSSHNQVGQDQTIQLVTFNK